MALTMIRGTSFFLISYFSGLTDTFTLTHLLSTVDWVCTYCPTLYSVQGSRVQGQGVRLHLHQDSPWLLPRAIGTR